MNTKDFKWTEKRFGTRFANILKKLGGVSKDSTDGSIEYKDEQGNITKLVTDSNFSSLLAKNGLIEVKWQELKDKRDNGELIPGSLYRITDYNCTTTQENTRSAGHQFDIVLLALSDNKLAEEGWAMMNESNIYDVTFADGVTKKCWIYKLNDIDCNIVVVDTLLGTDEELSLVAIDETNKTAVESGSNSSALLVPNLTYNYFQNSNLSAWKVWYCLDNDTARFAWADDGETESIDIYGDVYFRDSQDDADGYYAWKREGLTAYCFTKSPTPKVGDTIYLSDGSGNYEEDDPITAVSGFGRGVIYRLIDEFMNDVAYDFKNIQFVRPLTDGDYDAQGTDTWVYTFNSWDEENDVVFDASLNFDRANNNFVGLPFPDSFALADVVFIHSSSNSSSSGSNNCTLNYTSQIRLVACVGAIINAANSDYLYCDDTLVTTDADDPAIYINNKKVLTE